MAITYTREYPRATILPTEGSLSNVVKSVYCICKGIDENGTYESIGADIILDPPEETQFVDFNSLTKELIDSWVISKQEYLDLENVISIKINERISQTVVVELPFS